jgi:hypothetical protein
MRSLAILVTVLALGACSRKKADPDQGFHPDLQAGSDLQPPPAVGPGALAGHEGGGAMGGGAGSLPPAEGPMPNDDVHAGLAAAQGGGGGGGPDVGSMGFQSPDPNRPIDPKKFLRGTIHPSDATKARIPAGALIYVSVKKADPATGDAVAGMPIATDRLNAASWPLSFDLTEKNLMVAGGDFSGDVVVTARYAQNPDPLKKAPGDVVGHVRTNIPAEKLDVTLDTVLP